jgi:hypothetical protein
LKYNYGYIRVCGVFVESCGCQVDPDGRRVVEGYSSVYGTNRYHTYLLLIPDNINDFKNSNFKDLIQTYEMPDESKVEGIILRAGPAKSNPFDWGHLDARPNYKDDPRQSPAFKEIKAPELNGQKMSDTQFINKMLILNENYMNNPNKPGYTLPAMTNKLGFGGKQKFLGVNIPKLKTYREYNSNSYVSGLQKAAGVEMTDTLFYSPLYDKSLPSSYFGAE